MASYSFLPYLRQGLANSLKNTGGARAVFTVNLSVDADNGAATEATPPRDVELYGPGDITGIDHRMILKTDPHQWITNFEPNYLACIDFYDEDYPWRYTPLQPEAPHRLKPWLALVVLKEGEFEEGKNLMNRPLPYFTLKGIAAADVFPLADQLWAWAHVHVNGDIVGATLKDNPAEVAGVLTNLASRISNDPDSAYSRLICPRKLEPSTTYHAFLVPAFESGRLSGLGDTPANISAAGTKIAWQEGASPVDFPIYYRWKFATGTIGDFEYLVRLLKPMPADLRVGRRDMDMTNPGANLKWEEAPDLDLQGILRLGGALQVPRKTLPKEELDKLKVLDGWGKNRLPHPFQKQIAALLNLGDDYNYKVPDKANEDARETLPLDPNEDADPLITPPIYGRWHAMVERVLEDRDGNPIHNNYNWITELNLDPRYRVPAHFGTRVVQQNQEDYMDAAWEQVGDVLKANKQIRFALFAQAASKIWYQKYLKETVAVNPAKVMLFSSPVQTRILMDGATVFHTVRESVLPGVVLSATARRLIRPRGRFIKNLRSGSGGDGFKPEALVEKLSTGEIKVSPPKTIPPGLPSGSKLAEAFQPGHIPKYIQDILRRYPWLPVALLIFALLLVLLFLAVGGTFLRIFGLLLAAILFYLFWLTYNWSKAIKKGDAMKPENQTPESVDTLPKSPDFVLTGMGTFQPTFGNTDSEDAIKFKQALRDNFELIQATRKELPPLVVFKPIDIGKVAGFVVQKLDPAVTIPAWTWQNIKIPEWIISQMPEVFTEAMAYPRFDLPMYKPLAAISADLFLPNINLIEYNSITLLESNQEFIEAYMVGLNHEFARELLWREYPTDQRGSYFRQFWDVSTMLKTDNAAHAGKSEEEIREMYRDIPKLHRWSRNSQLGEHDHRQKPGTPETEEVVLVVRGELLKKYPNAVVYAHKAVWQRKDTAPFGFDKTQPRMLYQEGEGDKEEPSFDVIRTPLYKAEVEPDITFFGFKLDAAEAKGNSDLATPTLENAGWFFVFKERPGEPRFGFDIPKADVDAQPNHTWNDVSWSEVLPGNGVIDVLAPPGAIALSATAPDNDSPSFIAQREEDKKIIWNTDGHQVDAADLAYILYQVPVLVAVHASEMLPKTT